MQEQTELGKYVTDGKHVYPYNMYLDELLSNGTLKECDKPVTVPKVSAVAPMLRSPARMTPEERAALASKLGVSVGDIGNMSPQELAAAEADLAQQDALNAGFAQT